MASKRKEEEEKSGGGLATTGWAVAAAVERSEPLPRRRHGDLPEAAGRPLTPPGGQHHGHRRHGYSGDAARAHARAGWKGVLVEVGKGRFMLPEKAGRDGGRGDRRRGQGRKEGGQRQHGDVVTGTIQITKYGKGS